MKTDNKQDRLTGQLSHIEQKIADAQANIDYYKGIGARKDLSAETANIDTMKREADFYRELINGTPAKRDGIKVRVTEYGGKLVIETVDAHTLDEDFKPNGNGLIGCALSNNARLGISPEALELMQKFKRVGDVIGDLMGEEDSFTWIGGPMRVCDADSTVCRYFKMPKGFATIDNVTDSEFISAIDGKAAGIVSIEYDDFMQELWIELSVSGSWKKKEDGSEHMEHVYNDYYTLENTEGARFVGGSVYDPEVRILNAPDGMVKTDAEGHRTVLMHESTRKEILETVKNIFRKGDEPSWNIRVPKSEVMSYINPFFDLGFDNNVMNPRDGYWRMSITATPAVMLEKLKAFKRDESK